MLKRLTQSSRKITFEAVYRDGAFQPVEMVELPENTTFKVTVEVPAAGMTAVSSRWPGRGVWATAVRHFDMNWLLFGLALLVYAITRFVRLADYPIYFFSDEAIQAILADDLIRNRFRGPDGLLFPPYFKNYQVWNLSLSVYLQILPVALFGKSVFVTRAVSAAVSLMGVTAVGFILKWIFKARFWWVGVLVMVGIPAWYLHSRTAFETVLMVSFYALFLLFYLLYRVRSPRYIYLALVFAAAAFYSYSNGQAVIGMAALLLAISDFDYHRQQVRDLIRQQQGLTLLLILALAIALAIPYLRFRLNYPTDLVYHLRSLDSYLLRNLPLSEKVTLFAQKYLHGLSPGYWFFPNEHDLVRHRMAGYYGHMRPELLPFFVIGLALCLRYWRSPPHRALLLALLVTPIGAATVDIAITRVLSFVVPATVVISLGLDWTLSRLPSRMQLATALVCFGVLAGSGLWLWRDSLVSGPLWYRNYGMFGMQYGASQLFEIIEDELARDPTLQIMLTPTWANGTDLFPQFFLSPAERANVQTFNVDAFLLEKRPLSPETRFIMTPDEYERAITSGKFRDILVEKIFPYPDGSIGFYFARLAYVDNIDAIFAAEREARRRPLTSQLSLRNQAVVVSHSLLDSGSLESMFDGDSFTLGRVMEANPAFFEFTFPQPWALTGLAATFGTMDFQLTVSLYETADAEPVVYQQTYRGLGPDPRVELVFDRGPTQATRIRIEIEDLSGAENVKIHIREFDFGLIGEQLGP